jgi:chromosome segregation ATPase
MQNTILDPEERESLREDLLCDIKHKEEEVCKLSQEIIDTQSIIEQANESLRALITERNKANGTLNNLRFKFSEHGF